MTYIEREPEITALVYDASGGSHMGSLPSLEEIAAVDPDSNVNQAELLDRYDLTDMIALQSIRMSKLKADSITRHTKFIK